MFRSQDGIQHGADTRVKRALAVKYCNISNACFFAPCTAVIKKTCCLTIYMKTFLFPKSSYSRCFRLLASKWTTSIIYYNHQSKNLGQKSKLLRCQNGERENSQNGHSQRILPRRGTQPIRCLSP